MTTEAETIAALATKAAGAHVISNGDRTFLVVPEGFTHQEISDEFGLKTGLPRYINQAVTLQDAESLIEYVGTFGAEGITRLFADIGPSRIVARLDYHRGADVSAGRGAHIATLQLRHSVEWQVWSDISDKMQDHLDFARFLEENSRDIVDPDHASLIEAVRDIQVESTGKFAKAVRTNTDTVSFVRSEETRASTKGGAEIPRKFKLGIPVYFNGDRVEIEAFLRWSIKDGDLRLGIKLHRAEHVRLETFQRVVNDVVAQTGYPAVYGVS